MLVAAGASPPGPPDLDAWAARHPDLHSPDTLLAALRAHYDERALEWLPYLHRWLGGPSSEALESTLVGCGRDPRDRLPLGGASLSLGGAAEHVDRALLGCVVAVVRAELVREHASRARRSRRAPA